MPFNVGIPHDYDGAESSQGPRGEVSNQQLGDAMVSTLSAANANSPANTNAIDLIDTWGFTDPDALIVANKITAQRR